MSIHVVLVEAEIPQNTGNIARTCAAAGISLHLVGPLGFSIDEKSVRRAGLDYWAMVKVSCYDGLEDFFEKNSSGLYVFYTTKAKKRYDEIDYDKHENMYLFFGKESAGLPEELLLKHQENCVRIPMIDKARSLNLSNSAAIAVYEVLRQKNFTTLQTSGSLHRLKWRNV
ncbi:MAG: tRNA (cytidine(34)-2'-O)-methyltransferase [Spirochaetia bacterium]|nr:tRNA (cytidine(34)-2'-O)-methyltransferase [Spirochaetia bacterium]MCF7946469.1 tRNA (cytidine(34)-2'-O)-methyltransferase [Spirochaetia bacterium]